MKIIGFDHVQLAVPANAEAEARAFYGELLGLEEIPKPPVLAARGGVWFQCGRLQLHLGVAADFRPAKKAHPALRVDGYADCISRLQGAGYPVREDTAIAGVSRCFTSDPFGNRIELILHDDAAGVG
jgi:catechol 2,3-dioxygenase-like lactoylglutathione lyase family enzyme